MNYKPVNLWSVYMEGENLHRRSQISHFGAFQQLGHTILAVLWFSELKNFNTIVFLVKSYVRKVSILKTLQEEISFGEDEVIRSKLRKKINFEKKFLQNMFFGVILF